MKYLINKIHSKEYDLANEIVAESFVAIMEKKMLEKKKAVAAKMCEQMMTRAKKLRMDVLENIDPDEARGGPKPTGQTVNRIEKGDKESPNTTTIYKNNLKEDDMNLFDDDDDKKQKPRKAKLYRHKTSGKEIMHVGQPRDKDFKLVKEEDEQLDEARIGIIKARVRGGKVQRRKKVSNVPGFRLQGGQLKRMSAAERRRRKLGAKRGKIKRRVKMSRILQKRQRSLRRRASLGV